MTDVLLMSTFQEERKHRKEKALKFAQKQKDLEKAQQHEQQKWKNFSQAVYIYIYIWYTHEYVDSSLLWS